MERGAPRFLLRLSEAWPQSNFEALRRNPSKNDAGMAATAAPLPPRCPSLELPLPLAGVVVILPTSVALRFTGRFENVPAKRRTQSGSLSATRRLEVRSMPKPPV